MPLSYRARLKSHIPVTMPVERLREQMRLLQVIEAQDKASPDGQVSLTDPDARSMATSGRGSGIVGHNVQSAVEAPDTISSSPTTWS